MLPFDFSKNMPRGTDGEGGGGQVENMGKNRLF